MLNVIFFGDSITAGSEFPVEVRWTTLIQRMLDQHWPGIYRVHNRGIDGNTTAQGFDRYWTDVLPLLPGILVLQFGFNDANIKDLAIVPRVSITEYKKNMREFHRIASAHDSNVVFIMNHTIAAISGGQGNDRSYNENLAPYNAALPVLASELKSPYINIPELMLKRGTRLDKFLSGDGLHLTRDGNMDYAEMVFTALENIGVFS